MDDVIDEAVNGLREIFSKISNEELEAEVMRRVEDEDVKPGKTVVPVNRWLIEFICPICELAHQLELDEVDEYGQVKVICDECKSTYVVDLES